MIFDDKPLDDVGAIVALDPRRAAACRVLARTGSCMGYSSHLVQISDESASEAQNIFKTCQVEEDESTLMLVVL
jgi:hypothetical protein